MLSSIALIACPVFFYNAKNKNHFWSGHNGIEDFTQFLIYIEEAEKIHKGGLRRT
jgi:hypothetical protein